MNKKRKQMCILLIAVCTVVLLKYIFPYRVNIAMSNDVYINVLDGLNGYYVRIDNSDDVASIIEQLNNLKLINKRKRRYSFARNRIFNKRKTNYNLNGYLYVINFFNAKNENVFQLTVYDNKTIQLDDYSYTANATSIVNVLSDYLY